VLNELGVQYTVGLPLRKVPLLFSQVQNDTEYPELLSRLSAVCKRKGHTPCQDVYQGLILLVAHVLTRAAIMPDCHHPKLQQGTWLVRTHFGDMMNYARHVLEQSEIEDLFGDALEVANLSAYAMLHPHGIGQYFGFLDFAEIGGGFITRTNTTGKAQASAVPTDPASLYRLAETVLEHRDTVNRNLLAHEKACLVNGRRISKFPRGRPKLSAKEWLVGILQGKDLMSDRDSPFSAEVFSHTVWKSMGRWAMKGEGRVFLECRDHKPCLSNQELRLADHTELNRVFGVAKVLSDLNDL